MFTPKGWQLSCHIFGVNLHVHLCLNANLQCDIQADPLAIESSDLRHIFNHYPYEAGIAWLCGTLVPYINIIDTPQ